MIWLKKRFQFAEYAPAMDLLEKLMMSMPARYSEFLMVSTETGQAGVSDYYIGVPSLEMAGPFRDFEKISENDLPKVIDTSHLGDSTKEPFASHFKFKKR